MRHCAIFGPCGAVHAIAALEFHLQSILLEVPEFYDFPVFNLASSDLIVLINVLLVGA